MEYSIENKKEPKNGFVAYEITLCINSEIDNKILHDEVAIKIAKPCKFIKDVFMASSGNSDGKCGRIELRD